MLWGAHYVFWSLTVFYGNQTERNEKYNGKKEINANGSGILQCIILRNVSKVIPRY